MTMCTKALLEDPVPPVDLLPLRAAAASDIRAVINVQVKHWSALCFNKEMPKEDVLSSSTVKQNYATRNTENILSKQSSDDNISKNKDNDSIEALEEQFKSHLHIVNETPNLSESNSLATEVTNEEREKKSGQTKQQDSEMPGPSQGSSSSSSGATSTLRITMLDSLLQVSLIGKSRKIILKRLQKVFNFSNLKCVKF